MRHYEAWIWAFSLGLLATLVVHREVQDFKT